MVAVAIDDNWKETRFVVSVPSCSKVEELDKVLLVRVCVSVVPTTAPVGAPERLPITIDPACCVTLLAATRASDKVPEVIRLASTETVLLEELMVLFVNVCVSVVPTTEPVGAPERLPITIDPACCVTLLAATRASVKVPEAIRLASTVTVLSVELMVLFVRV